MRLSYILALVILIPVANAPVPVFADAAQDNLVRLWDQYRIPRSVHCVIEMKMDGRDSHVGIGIVEAKYEYWAVGKNYRAVHLVDPTKVRGRSYELRWDGERFQKYIVEDSTLLVSSP